MSQIPGNDPFTSTFLWQICIMEEKSLKPFNGYLQLCENILICFKFDRYTVGKKFCIDVFILNDLVPHFLEVEVERNSLWELVQISGEIQNISLIFQDPLTSFKIFSQVYKSCN